MPCRGTIGLVLFLSGWGNPGGLAHFLSRGNPVASGSVQRAMKRTGLEQGKGGLELLEEASHLLRNSSAGTLASYYVGAIPFVLCLLFFWADMSRSPFAEQHLAGGALGLAAIFLWMKFCQAIFLRRLTATLSGIPAPPLTLRKSARIFITQAALQPLGLVLLPLALALAVPFGWVFAFFQNLTAVCKDESAELRPLVNQALRQARLWPSQNHIFLALLSGLGLCVFLNWATVCYILPGLVQMLFGTESLFTRSSTSLLNSTFFAAMFGLTYLCVDPVVKAAYALRCFYGQSLESGEDLKADLKPFTFQLRKFAAVLLALFGMSVAMSADGLQDHRVLDSPPPATQTAKNVAPADLDRAIQEVSQKSKYAWRMPRERITGRGSASQGLLDRFLERIGTMVRDWLRGFGNWLDKLLRKLFSRQRPIGAAPSGYGWIMVEEVLLYVLITAAVIGLAWIAYRIWHNRHARAEPVSTQPIQLAPDLSDERLDADQLPEDSWTRLGQEMLARGVLRLALRAFYLASLAHLAQRNLISLAKFKSNRDYLLELRRRAHSFPDLLDLFGDNVATFDRTWYGLHRATADLVTEFASNVERMKTSP